MLWQSASGPRFQANELMGYLVQVLSQINKYRLNITEPVDNTNIRSTHVVIIQVYEIGALSFACFFLVLFHVVPSIW